MQPFRIVKRESGGEVGKVDANSREDALDRFLKGSKGDRSLLKAKGPAEHKK